MNAYKIFKRWFDEYKNLIFKIVKTYTDSPQDQDDLFQNILLQLWSSIPNFQGESKETTWIYRVALNTALVWKRGKLRKRKKRQQLLMDLGDANVIKKESDNSIQDQQIVDRLYDAIRKLAKIDSSIVLMYLDGISYDEMAEILGISKNNVGVRLNRAKKQLAQLLEGLIDDF